jgi:hypothetical protein
MIEKINRTEEIMNRLKSEGKFSYLNAPEHIEAIEKMNKEMKKLKREYITKDKLSQISAAKTILNA